MSKDLLSVIEQQQKALEELLSVPNDDSPESVARCILSHTKARKAIAAGQQALEQTQGDAGPTSLELPVGYRSPEDWYGWNTMTLFRPAWSKLSKGMQASVAAEYRTALAKLKGESAPEVIHLFSDQLENDPTKRDLVDKDGNRYLPQDAVLANC